ncbi:MAG TPA: heme-binding domain-containing protein [Candidatus Krumholzibacteria bacterium]|nr:heme-binding domain-containing protein [Candidatus Krumholzibacteria bacterium]
MTRSTRRTRIAGRLAVTLAALVVAIQLVPVDRSAPAAGHEVGAPAGVADLLRRACYDCHSGRTAWPWYSRVAPVSWFVADHVREGRRALDFTDWPALDLDLQDELLRHVADEVGKGDMPLASYRLAHPAARLTAAQRDSIVAWAEGR